VSLAGLLWLFRADRYGCSDGLILVSKLASLGARKHDRDWRGSPLTLFVDQIAGFKPPKVGFREAVLKPDLVFCFAVDIWLASTAIAAKCALNLSAPLYSCERRREVPDMAREAFGV
jgi:hypothetical protein